MYAAWVKNAGKYDHWRSLVSVLCLGAAITFTQILFVCVVESRPRLVDGYLRLFQWDSLHYAELMTTGYRNTLPPLIGDTDPGVSNFQKNTNVSFFPGYVIAGKVVRALTGFTPRISLLLAAALAAWGFWSMLLLLLRHWQLSVFAQIIVLLAIVVHPAAFFLVAAYSESLFLLGLIGLLFWSQQKKTMHGVMAAVCGTVMTGTRIFGAALVVYPVIVSALRKESRAEKVKNLLRSVAISVTALSGMAAFFGYSSLVLGKWNLYMRVQEKMWGIAPDYFFLLRWSDVFPLPMIRHPVLYGNNLSPLLATITFWFLCAGVALDVMLTSLRTRPDVLRPERAGLWACAASVFYMTAASLVGSEFRSMLRYTYIPYVLFVLALALLLRDIRWSRDQIIFIMIPFVGFLLISLLVQQYLIHAFTAGLWVA